MSERIKGVHYDKNKDEPSSVHIVQPDGTWLDVSGFVGSPEIMGGSDLIWTAITSLVEEYDRIIGDYVVESNRFHIRIRNGDDVNEIRIIIEDDLVVIDLTKLPFGLTSVPSEVPSGDERLPYRLVYSYEEANAMIDTGLQMVNAFKGVRSMMKTKRQPITKQGDSHDDRCQ